MGGPNMVVRWYLERVVIAAAVQKRLVIKYSDCMPPYMPPYIQLHSASHCIVSGKTVMKPCPCIVMPVHQVMRPAVRQDPHHLIYSLLYSWLQTLMQSRLLASMSVRSTLLLSQPLY